MAYVKRDENGNIVGIFSHSNDSSTEYVENPVLYKSATDIFEEMRREEYIKDGVTIESMVIALWEGDQVIIDAMEAKRQAVKLRVPK